jgi:HEAT repeat protein
MESNGNPISMPPQEDLTEVQKPTSLLIAQFFLFPLIIIAFGIGVFVLFGFITYDQKSPRTYLTEIRQNAGYSPFDTRRWQAALELSKVISAQKEELRGTSFGAELISVYENAKTDDTRIRRFLAVSLGHLGDPAAVPALAEGLADTDTETQIWTLWALGTIADKQAAPAVITKLQSEDSGIRMMAAHVLGALKDPVAIHDLQIALNDTAAAVRWNAAMALAQMNDAAGVDLLIELTSRDYLAQFSEMSEEDKNNAIVNAVKCLSLLRIEGARDKIALLSESDPSLLVRDAALEALNTY